MTAVFWAFLLMSLAAKALKEAAVIIRALADVLEAAAELVRQAQELKKTVARGRSQRQSKSKRRSVEDR